MCGILGVIQAADAPVTDTIIDELRIGNKRLKHRGPDGEDIAVLKRTPEQKTVAATGGTLLGHTRLSIIDIDGGHQPIKDLRSDLTVIVNGEIYNHKQLHSNCAPNTKFISESDSEIVLHLYKEHEERCFDMLDGIFACALSDGCSTVLARDALGIKPLYVGVHSNGSLWFSSEIKGINSICSIIAPFPPGCYWKSSDVTPSWLSGGDSGETGDNIENVRLGAITLQCRRWFKPHWWSGKTPCQPHDSAKLFRCLDLAVKKRMMADVPVAVFLSGGLDSSTMAALAKRHLPASQKDLHSFSVGVGSAEQSPDILAARVAAKAIGTIHHELIFQPDEGFAAVRDVIYHLESYDPSPIRSGVAMHLLCGEVAKYAKVCICGEAADEVFAGYLYFKDAKDKHMLHRETTDKIKNLHGVQLQFQDRLGMGQSLEIRVPFLDKALLEEALSVDPEIKMHVNEKLGSTRIEKWYLRDAIAKHGDNLLPKEILWRRKEQFGDGVGYSWIMHLKQLCEARVSDEQLMSASMRFPEDTPVTKEQYYYRSIFDELFPGPSAQKSVNRWFPWSVQDNSVDASAREYAKDEYAKINEDQ